MKKLITIVLAMALLLPVISLADSPVVGVWVQNHIVSTEEWRLTTIQINENGLAFYAVQYFTKSGPGETEKKLLTWRLDRMKTLVMLDGETEYKTLYLKNNAQLSADPAGTYGFFNKVPNNEQEYNDSVVDAETEINYNPICRWTTYMDVGQIMITAIDYYFLEDGTVYAISADYENGDMKLGKSSGVWIGDKDNLIVRIGSKTEKGFISDDGILYLQDEQVYAMLYYIPGDRQVFDVSEMID